MILRTSSDASERGVRGRCGGGAMRVTAAARRRPVRCVADDSALSSVKVTVYNDMPRKGSPRGLPISSTGSPDSGSQHAHPDPLHRFYFDENLFGFTSIY